MQLNRTGIILIAFFRLFGIGFLIAQLHGNRTSAFFLIGVIWVAVSLGLLVYAWRGSKQAKHDEWLFKTGVKGRATIVSAKSGALVNNQPLMTFELDVEVPGQEVRRATKKLIVSDFAGHRMQPGLVLAGLRQPRRPERFPAGLVGSYRS